MTALADLQWFHALRFPDGQESAGRFSVAVPPNYTLFGPLALLRHLDVREAVCMDMGTMDGLMAWSLSAAGAKEVVATDVARRQTFEFARDRYALDVEYRVPFVVNDLRNAPAPAFDLIVFSGVLYHVFDPLPSLITLRRSIREGGYLLLETQYQHAERGSQLSFAPSERRQTTGHPNTFFRPSFSAMIGMLEMSGFQPVTSIAVKGRLTVLAQAARPSQVKTRSRLVREVLKRYNHYSHYAEDVDYAALEAGTGSARIGYEGPVGDYVLHAARFVPTNGFQPAWQPSRRHYARALATDLVRQVRASFARRRWIPHWPQG